MTQAPIKLIKHVDANCFVFLYHHGEGPIADQRFLSPPSNHRVRRNSFLLPPHLSRRIIHAPLHHVCLLTSPSWRCIPSHEVPLWLT